jgi:tetratricopeptide (TPR) repeat protein
VLLATVCAAQQAPRTQAVSKTSAPKTSAAEISARLSRAAAAADSGRLNEARAEYERVIKEGGSAQIEGDFDQARRLGLCYLNGSPQKLGEAARWLEAANRVKPGDADVALYLAQSYAWSGRHDDAIRVYNGLRARFPNNADYVIGLANAQYAKGDTGAALTMLQGFTQTAPSNIPIRLLYARFLGYSKEYVQSIAQYQQILQVDPRNTEASVGVAKVTSWQGDNDTALQLYDKVLKSEPRNYDALVGKAYSLLWLGRKTEARQLFAGLNARNPGDREIAATLRTLPAPEPAAETSRAVAQARKPLGSPLGAGSVPQTAEPLPQPSVKETTAAEPVNTTSEVA